MKIWKNTKLDSLLLTLVITHFVVSIRLALEWNSASMIASIGGFVLLMVMTVYNIIVITHIFSHQGWFQSATLNRIVSMFNSINVGQSVQVYRLMHVKNHHRYNNDEKGPDGTTKDISSTYRNGVDNNHDGLFHYAFVGGFGTLLQFGRDLLSITRLWRVGNNEHEINLLATNTEEKRIQELRQVQLDRMAIFVGFCTFLAIDWQWTIVCYVPALYLSFVLVNVQNYFEHYGAAPTSRYADSVSYYGRLYNLLTFNDGYHQEHHFRPQVHWRGLPELRQEVNKEVNEDSRVVSPVPALLGFLCTNRPPRIDMNKLTRRRTANQ